MTRHAIRLALLVWSRPLGALAADLEFRESVPVKPGGTLQIELATGSVEVQTDDAHEVSIEARARGWGAGSMRFELSSDGEDAQLVGEPRGWFGPLVILPRVRVKVRVPERYSIEIRTGGGSIEIDDLGGTALAKTNGGRVVLDGAEGPVELTTSGGSIDAEDVRGDLSVRTSGGGIRISDVTGRVEAETSGGPIRVHDVGGPVLARTSGGSISVRFSGAPEGDLETSGGAIEAEFDEKARLNLEAETSGGRVRVEDDLQITGSITSDRVEGRINGGGPSLRLKTSGGNVRIRLR